MKTFLVILLICLGLAGCATPVRPSDRDGAAEARGYERGYRQAVKEQYWLIQNQQRRSAPVEPTIP
ncbi:MAG: hypothetical protein CFE26_25080 [Verrucomicrobiales bacterium VVV1]|nr:MAG: hypothetical protein CFE26_25080 [Verrucomicrobiales bacterium VVV1]